MFHGKRIKGIDAHIRTIEVKNKSIIIEDRIEGHGSHRGVLTFHIAGGWKVTETDKGIRIDNDLYHFLIRSDDCNISISHDEKKTLSMDIVQMNMVN